MTKSGDFLEDIDIFIEIRSSKTKFGDLDKLLKCLKQASVSLLNTEAVVVTESNIKVNVTPQKTLSTVSTRLQIK